MTEEERKAVEFVKKRTKELKKYAKRENELVYDDIILNLIEKLQKENEEYSKQLDLDYVDKNYISKQKIKDEIVELQKMNVDGEVFRTSVNFAIITFQKLLDKEN